MLLRRITKHVNDQNWLAVFIDFLIVVVGVFIGIQVTNWNTQRVEQSLEFGYLERLKDEVTESRDVTRFANESWIAQVDLLNLVIDSLDKCEIAENDKDNFAEGLYHLGKFELAYLNNSTLEEMRSTGRIGIIKNADIRDALAQLEKEVSYQESVGPQLTARISPHFEYVSQRISFRVTSIDEVLKMNEKFGDESFPFSSVASYSLDTLCEDSKIIASISSIRATVYETMDWNGRIANDMDEALALINIELGE